MLDFKPFSKLAATLFGVMSVMRLRPIVTLPMLGRHGHGVPAGVNRTLHLIIAGRVRGRMRNRPDHTVTLMLRGTRHGHGMPGMMAGHGSRAGHSRTGQNTQNGGKNRLSHK